MAVFTQAQSAAVASKSDKLLILAAAGSGKSTTLVERVSSMLIDGDRKPEKFLCITFTRKAADEFRKKIEARVGKDIADRITINTFHGTGYSLLCEVLGKALTIASPDEVQKVLKDIAESNGFKKESLKSWLNEKNLYCQNRHSEMSIGGQRVIRELYSRMSVSGAIDFDYIIPMLLNMCSESRIRDIVSSKFDYIFVDEYQDTDNVQQRFLETMNPVMLTCVGDADQSIYSFRNANVKLITDMARQEDVEVIKLEDCFRCKPSIVSAANSLIRNNTDRPDVTMNSAVLVGKGVVRRIECDSSAEMTQRVAETIKGIFDEANVDPGNFAIIARNHRSLDDLEYNLKCGDNVCDFVRNLPFNNVGKKTSIFESDLFRGIIASARLALNPNDEFAFYTVAKNVYNRTDNDYRMALISRKLHPEAGFDISLSSMKSLKWSDFVNMVIALYKSHHCEDAFVWEPEQIEEIMQYAGDTSMSIEDILAFNRNKDFQSDLEKEENAITLITSHASKGLEWSNVLVVDFNDGTFPSRMSLKENGIEEERRLAYVTFTRAADRLFIFTLKKCPSRFVEEAGL